MTLEECKSSRETAVLVTWSDWSPVSVIKAQVQRCGAVYFSNSFSTLPVVTELLSPYTYQHSQTRLQTASAAAVSKKEKSCVCFHQAGIHLSYCSIQQMLAFQRFKGALYSTVESIFTLFIYSEHYLHFGK